MSLEQIKAIPQNNALHANRYDTDDTHVLHVWDDAGNSYDITYPKNITTRTL